ncbi:restriction endonuclease subunit S [Alicyclobacillus sp. TC]|nr:restriction endonuclease subunit S [Alicyclobacillus sp. TC]
MAETMDDSMANICRPGDVLFGKLRPYLAKVVMSEGTYRCTPEFLVLRAYRYQPTFLRYLLLSNAFIDLVNSSTYGVKMPRASWDFIGEIRVPVPPADAQRSISSFLDHETAKLDQLVEKKQRLIELLQEKRQALITQAVTKGLDPNVPMKDSGIPWLGEVPAHWEIAKTSRVAISIQTGPFGSQLHTEDYVDDGIPVINPSHLVDGDIVPDPTCAVSPVTKQRLIRHELMSGDIVFARRGEIGRCALVTEAEQGFLCGTGCFRLRLDSQIVNPAFVVLLFSTPWMRDWLLIESVGSTMDNLNTQILSSTPLLIPPLTEQHRIVQRVSEISEAIRQATKKLEQQAVLLSEYRQALITAAVTGKIDVRQYSSDHAEVVSQ